MAAGGECSVCVNEKDGISVIAKQGRKYDSLKVLCTALNMSFPE